MWFMVIKEGKMSPLFSLNFVEKRNLYWQLQRFQLLNDLERMEKMAEDKRLQILLQALK